MIMSLFSFLFCPSHHYGNPQSKKGRRKVFDLISPGVFATSFDLSVDTIPSGSSALGIEQPGLPEIHSFVSWIPIGEVWEITNNSKAINWKSQKSHYANLWQLEFSEDGSTVALALHAVLESSQPLKSCSLCPLLVKLDGLWWLSWPTEYSRSNGLGLLRLGHKNDFPKKLKIESPCDPTILLQGIHPEKTKTLIWKETCTLIHRIGVFMEATCVHQRRNGQRRCGICVHTQTRTVEYYSAVKKSDILPFAAMWADLEMIILSEVRQRKTNIIRYHFYVGLPRWH